MKEIKSMIQNPNRRQFVKSTAVATGAIAAPFILPSRGFAQNSETIKVGLIGCGGRGTGAASQALSADNNVVLSAVGDVFEDRLDGSLKNLRSQMEDKVQVDPDHQFIGFDAYRKVIDSGVDVVILTTPPGFRPMHLEYAIQ
ncbi:MAG: twin-arginine translocation signal domain-containing protein, partial [Verrucomicrobia bacterium]|nr:twin-arginine translocation signal domain-containing protein [Verrucomicrobiota bacterium]